MARTDLRTSDFDYPLPQELIAQTPAERRELSRLMVIERAHGTIVHQRFADIGRHLAPGDLLIANRSRVIPARLRVRRETGGAVELLLLRQLAPERWLALARPSRKLRPGMRLTIEESGMTAQLFDQRAEGQWVVQFDGAGDIRAEIERVGEIPLPPYIRNETAPRDRYQTVYADRDGSIAAPTAGLHLSESLLDELRGSGVRIEFITLHVGLGTFRPVTVERIADHHMDAEWGEVPEQVVEAIASTRDGGGRVVAVGTTTTRLLETAAESGTVQPFRGETAHFIYPGYAFRVIDGLVTNFHLPRSTLLMLVSAFAGRDLILQAYQEAIDERYRFYSFGDAMLIL